MASIALPKSNDKQWEWKLEELGLSLKKTEYQFNICNIVYLSFLFNSCCSNISFFSPFFNCSLYFSNKFYHNLLIYVHLDIFSPISTIFVVVFSIFFAICYCSFSTLVSIEMLSVNKSTTTKILSGQHIIYFEPAFCSLLLTASFWYYFLLLFVYILYYISNIFCTACIWVTVTIFLDFFLFLILLFSATIFK